MNKITHSTSLGPLYKILNLDGTCCNGGKNTWDLSGAWMPAIEGDLIPCERGYHLCRPQDLVHWLGPAIYPAEINGDDWIDNGYKIVARQARITGPALATWNDRTARLFAADCAEHVIHLTGLHPDCVRAIAIARRYARGGASEAELSAARITAWAAARDARDAARAVRDAARAVAWDAAGAAAWAAKATERKWQTELLLNVLGIEAAAEK